MEQVKQLQEKNDELSERLQVLSEQVQGFEAEMQKTDSSKNSSPYQPAPADNNSKHEGIFEALRNQMNQPMTNQRLADIY